MAGIGSATGAAEAQALFPATSLFPSVGVAGSLGVAGAATPVDVAPGTDQYQTAQFEINAFASATIADSLGASQGGPPALGALSVPGESQSQTIGNALSAQSLLILSGTVDTTA